MPSPKVYGLFAAVAEISHAHSIVSLSSFESESIPQEKVPCGNAHDRRVNKA